MFKSRVLQLPILESPEGFERIRIWQVDTMQVHSERLYRNGTLRGLLQDNRFVTTRHTLTDQKVLSEEVRFAPLINIAQKVHVSSPNSGYMRHSNLGR